MAPVVVLPRAIGPMGAAGVQRVRVRAPRWAPAIAPAYVTTAHSAFAAVNWRVPARGRRGSRVSAPPTCCPLAGGVQIPVQIGGRGSRFHDQIRVTVLTVSGLSGGPAWGCGCTACQTRRCRTTGSARRGEPSRTAWTCARTAEVCTWLSGISITRREPRPAPHAFGDGGHGSRVPGA